MWRYSPVGSRLRKLLLTLSLIHEGAFEALRDSLRNILPTLLPVELFRLAFAYVYNLGPLDNSDRFGFFLCISVGIQQIIG